MMVRIDDGQIRLEDRFAGRRGLCHGRLVPCCHALAARWLPKVSCLPSAGRATAARRRGSGCLHPGENAAISLFYCVITMEQMTSKPKTAVAATRDHARLIADLCEALLSPANPT